MKGKEIALWIVNVLLAALFLFAGSTKLMSNPEMVTNFAKYGYGEGFLHFIGAAEVLGGIGLLVPRTRFWAAALLIPIMLGALQTHLSHGEASHSPPVVVFLVLLGVSAYFRRDEIGRFFAKGGLFTGR